MANPIGSQFTARIEKKIKMLLAGLGSVRIGKNCDLWLPLACGYGQHYSRPVSCWYYKHNTVQNFKWPREIIFGGHAVHGRRHADEPCHIC